MTKESKPKFFICYALENQGLLTDFVRHFEKYHDLELEYFDQKAHTGNIHANFQRFASDCDVAVLLINARFTNLGSYAQKHEVPILLERQQRGEVIIIGILFSDVDLTEWNAEGDVSFFPLRYNELRWTRIPDGEGTAFNSEFAAYEILDSRDYNTFHKKLKKYTDELWQQPPQFVAIEPNTQIDRPFSILPKLIRAWASQRKEPSSVFHNH